MEWNDELMRRLEAATNDDERREIWRAQISLWDAISPEDEMEVISLVSKGWIVMPGLSGYVIFNPDGEMEWWRGVAATENSAWRSLIHFPVAQKPDLSGATEQQQQELRRLFKGRTDS